MSLLSIWGWINEHLSAGALLIMVGAVASVIQLSPIKLDPWTWLLRMIRNGLGLTELTQSVNKLSCRMDEQDALNARRRILRFNDELLQNMQHSKEMFNNVLDDITDYERYCKDHKYFKNQKADLAIDNVRRVYKECMKDNSFL